MCPTLTNVSQPGTEHGVVVLCEIQREGGALCDKSY
jgi:hypothetical protein